MSELKMPQVGASRSEIVANWATRKSRILGKVW